MCRRPFSSSAALPHLVVLDVLALPVVAVLVVGHVDGRDRGEDERRDARGLREAVGVIGERRDVGGLARVHVVVRAGARGVRVRRDLVGEQHNEQARDEREEEGREVERADERVGRDGARDKVVVEHEEARDHEEQRREDASNYGRHDPGHCDGRKLWGGACGGGEGEAGGEWNACAAAAGAMARRAAAAKQATGAGARGGRRTPLDGIWSSAFEFWLLPVPSIFLGVVQAMVLPLESYCTPAQLEKSHRMPALPKAAMPVPMTPPTMLCVVETGQAM